MTDNILPFKPDQRQTPQAEIDAVTDMATEYTAQKDYDQAKALLDSALWAIAGRLSKGEILDVLKQAVADIEDHVSG